jgi:uncharacterized SAM-binding protein YcdF (DUF218 family)
MKHHRPRLGRLLALAVALSAVVGLALGVKAAGLYLVAVDPLAPSDAIFVLDGMTPAREVEAAMLYRRGLAPVVVLSRARDPLPAARPLAGEPGPQERAARALEHAGVPRRAIVRLDRTVENTRQELSTDFEYARAHGLGRVILVTSLEHSRRVRIIWNSRHQATVPALIHPTPYDPFDPQNWWRSRRSLEHGLHELIGIVHFWVGSPLPTFGRKE